MTQTNTTIKQIRFVNQPSIVFDHARDKQGELNLPDAQVTAWRESDGTVNLTIPHYENYRMRGPDLAHLHIDPKVILSSIASAGDPVEDHYNYRHWIMSPYTFDGKNIFSLVHSEWYACLLHGDCTEGSNQINSWVTTITAFTSADGGASWGPLGANASHNVAAMGYKWTGSRALNSSTYRTTLDHTGLTVPTRIIKEGNYFYSIANLIHRDSATLDANGSAPIDKFGFVLLRSGDLSNPASWGAWTGAGNFSPVADGKFQEFLPVKNGGLMNVASAQMIYDTHAQTYILFFSVNCDNLSSCASPLYYTTTKSLANPSWSESVQIAGSDTIRSDPRGPGTACSQGFKSYISVIDDQSPGFNFEFTAGHPWLFYVVNPGNCDPNKNLERDLYRLELAIDYEGQATPTPAPNPLSPLTLTNVYRFFLASSGEHFLTTNYSEGIGAGYSPEGVAFRVVADGADPTASTTLYRCYWSAEGQHFTSTSAACEGLKTEGSYGNIYPEPHPETFPLYRFYKPGGSEHLTTINPDEAYAAGYQLDGIQGYAYLPN